MSLVMVRTLAYGQIIGILLGLYTRDLKRLWWLIGEEHYKPRSILSLMRVFGSGLGNVTELL
ncbi:hypothetical protein RHMOL_Rhmol12G0092500 [Rhododendron molle]|uniref:Uncharacterized protein n=1 Tax=Rhododendron molle TaxID=49168 RepID=A0ACC0LH52_RHOML|nr:hypothetical protein RHMOL_Rhmol12G0092500 [Rhododendron molle]